LVMIKNTSVRLPVSKTDFLKPEMRVVSIVMAI